MLSDDKSNNEPENSTNWEQFSLEKDNFLLDRILMRRLAQRRIRFGILGIVLGLMIFVLADVIAKFSIPNEPPRLIGVRWSI